ncbi:hypothetical protein [Glutamicibacter sp. TV12E]|uniref:hypothetical protein n=1 Tax=Glutamicibacter sp. TV12E TaxID=3446362 RepID=UPI0040335F43
MVKFVESLQLTRAQIEAKYQEATQQGCGLYVVKGRPNTLDVAPGAVAGELLIVDPSAIS